MGPTWLTLSTSEGRPEAQNRSPSIHQLFICPFIKRAFSGGFDIRIKPYVQPSPGILGLNLMSNHLLVPFELVARIVPRDS